MQPPPCGPPPSFHETQSCFHVLTPIPCHRICKANSTGTIISSLSIWSAGQKYRFSLFGNITV